MDNQLENIDDINHSTKIHLSYALGSFLNDFISTALSMWVFKFYETEVFLPIAYITLTVIIYGLWNMFNDPLAGHISDMPMGLTKKWGKRFSWFIITAIPCSLVFFFIFIPPMNMNYLVIFLWALAMLCILDTLFSFLTINWQSVYPDKFRSHQERTKVGALQVLCSLFGLTLGLIIPIFIITNGPPGTNVGSYINMALIISIICLIIVILMIPGMQESGEMIQRTLRLEQKEKEYGKYFEKIKFAFKQKNFIAYLFAYLAQNVAMVLMLASLPYWTQYVVNFDDIIQMLLLAGYLLASISSVPLWIKISRKYGNRIGYICGTGLSALFLIITASQIELISLVICFMLIGFSMGATWALMYPTFSDIIDEIVVETNERNDGVYFGFRTFFGRLSIVIQALTFGILHTITNFNPRSSTQTNYAQWGIQFGMFIVPAIFYMIGFFLMWKIYDLRPHKVQTLKEKLKELNL